MADRPYDIVIFGASGFTGQYVVDELARTVEEEEGGIRWAIAGRSSSKLIQTLRNACDRTGKDLSRVQVIRADVDNEESLNNLAQKTRVLLNCVGPYRLYGEPVVKACAANGTHHLDLSGEPGFLDSMFLCYDEEARKSGAKIIGSCGWDTIPSDMAITFMKQNFAGDLAWVESFLSVHRGKTEVSFNIGTFMSGVYNAVNTMNDMKLHQQIVEKKLPSPAYKIPWRFPLFWSREISDWCMMLPDSEECVIERSQLYNYQQNQQRPVQYHSYFQPGSFLKVLFFVVTGMIFGTLSFFQCGRRLLQKYPRLLSGGIFKKGGPTREQVNSSSFTSTFVGYGWDTKLPDVSENHKKPPKTRCVAKVNGPDLAYIATPICMLQATYSLLADEQVKNKNGGVYTPASLFSDSTLIQRLHSHGVTFSMEEK